MPPSTHRLWIARGLAHALQADCQQPGGTEAHALLARATRALGHRPPWLPPVIEALGAAAVRRLDLQGLSERIAGLPAFDAAFAPGQPAPRIRRLMLRPPHMAGAPLGLHEAPLPALTTHEALGDWLGLAPERLAWLVSEAQHYREPPGGRPGAARHYHALLRPKRLGGLRLIEAPKAELKLAQRRLLDGLLNAVPVHEAAQGFVPGRSVRAHAQAHAGAPVVLRFDLQDFFPSVPASRVHAIWRTLGYPAGVARALTALCTTRTPAAVRARLREAGAIDGGGAQRLAAAHLPQGAPTSPALANLCCFRLDLRLAGLAAHWGARYTRYADDLVFSGPAVLRERRLALTSWVGGICADEGFTLHARKTRCMPQHRQQCITGVVVNQHPNLPRDEFDRLKACLHRRLLHGATDAAEREALRGRIAWAAQLNPARGEKLLALFAQIRWPQPGSVPG
ncbi:MAG: RNA-directed DNA polymerase [Burkholderiales bacterium]|nr:RNA-directed DNA polymerase [Burkholderiales bacterium]